MNESSWFLLYTGQIAPAFIVIHNEREREWIDYELLIAVTKSIPLCLFFFKNKRKYLFFLVRAAFVSSLDLFRQVCNAFPFAEDVRRRQVIKILE